MSDETPPDPGGDMPRAGNPLRDGPLPPHHQNCFGCGPQNASGLGLQMRAEHGRLQATLVFDRRHEGAPGFAHGGAVAAALDDMFGAVLVATEAPAVTVNLNVDYRAPVMLGHALDLSAWCSSVHGRKLHMRGEIRDDNQLVAEARALFLEVEPEHFLKPGASLDDAEYAWLT